jgi:iron(III) transport system permease protein
MAVILPLGYFFMLTLYKFIVPFPTLEILTLDNWYRVLGFKFTWTAIKNSLFLGFVAGAVAILLGLSVAWTVVRTEVRGRQFLDVLATVPIAVPAIVVGIAYLWAALSFPGGFYGSIIVIAIALVARYFPYAVRVLDNNIRQISAEMEEVAHTAGADWQTTFRKITIPLLRPGIAASFVLLYASFVRSITIPALLYSSESAVTSTLMLSLWFDGNLSQVAVVGVIQLIMIVTGIVIFMKVFEINLDDVTAR